MALNELNNIPVSEKNVPYEIAQPWFKVSDQDLDLEGLNFDPEKNLYFVDVFEGHIFKLTLDKKLSVIKILQNEGPSAIKIHKNGDLFICCSGNFRGYGSIIALNPKTKKTKEIVPKNKNLVIDDMVFTSEGGFYFSNFKGSVFNPTGQIYYVDKNLKKPTLVINHLAGPNGLCLSPDERHLWITETNANRLNNILFQKDHVTIPPYMTTVPYYFSGYGGADSCSIDADGNLYVAMSLQGRFLCFNPQGILVKQILLPGRENGHMLFSTHPMIMPDTNTLIMCSNDNGKGQGSWLFKAQALGKSFRSFQFS